jgi:hypothetical protein
MIRYLNLIFFAGMIVMNYLANALPLNGRTTGELSSAYPNLFTPAGVTFSIWGVIYLLLAGYCIVQLSGRGRPVAEGLDDGVEPAAVADRRLRRQLRHPADEPDPAEARRRADHQGRESTSLQRC